MLISVNTNARVVQLVDQRSAVLGITNEVIIPVNADHVSICKYESVGSEIYKLVLSQIKKLITDATTLHLREPVVRSPSQTQDKKGK